MALVDITTSEQFKELVSSVASGSIVVHFFASWAPQCVQMNDVLLELSALHPKITYAKIEAEVVPEISLQYEIAAVPTFIFFAAGAVVDRFNGANAPELAKKVAALSSRVAPEALAPQPQGHAAASAAAPPTVVAATTDITKRIKEVINAAPVMVFIKGSADEPRCGFSAKIIGILREAKAEFSAFDILEDDEVRQALKEYSNWPTYPQLYVKGELVGGVDIVSEMAATGELAEVLAKATETKDLNTRLKELVNRDKIMLFMKGSPAAPRCGFSRTTIDLLTETGLKYSTYDILGDEEVRQGLKAYSDWPTYPQLYVRGELVGGLDILKELKTSGELIKTLDPL